MKKNRSLLLLLVVALMSLFVAACTSGKEEAKAGEAETRTVKHAKGEAEIPVDPKRIVDLSGSTEELILLDKKPISTANTFKQKIQKHIAGDLEGVEALGWYWDDKVDLEKVMELNPDMIILNNRQLKLYDQAAKVAPTVVLETELTDWRGKFKEVARLFDQEEKAVAWLADYDKKAADLSTKIKEKTKDEKFMFLAVTKKDFRVYGNYGYGDVLFNDLKLPNIERKDLEKPYDQVSLEGLHAFNPEHLMVVNFGGEDADKFDAELKKSAIWNNMTAVKNNNLYVVDNESFNIKGFNPIGKMSALEDIEKMVLKK
jgi:iron complex transport system substrate-binding protein